MTTTNEGTSAEERADKWEAQAQRNIGPVTAQMASLYERLDRADAQHRELAKQLGTALAQVDSLEPDLAMHVKQNNTQRKALLQAIDERDEAVKLLQEEFSEGHGGAALMFPCRIAEGGECNCPEGRVRAFLQSLPKESNSDASNS